MFSTDFLCDCLIVKIVTQTAKNNQTITAIKQSHKYFKQKSTLFKISKSSG